MRPFFKALNLLCIAASMCTPPFAVEATDDTGRLMAYMETSHFLKRLHEAAITTDAYLRYYCDRQKYEIRYDGKFRVLNKVVKPAGTMHPQSGLWQAQYKVTRCGETKIYNAAFLARKNKPPRLIVARPGTTRVSPGVYGDMRPGLFAQATATAGKDRCYDIRVVDTNLLDERQNYSYEGTTFKQLVHEEWTLDVCWQPVKLSVLFIQIEGTPGTSIAFDNPVKLPVTAHIPGSLQKDGSRQIIVSLNEMSDLLKRIDSNDRNDSARAIATIKEKALQNFDEYQYLLATIYLEGRGVGKDINTAMYWAIRAAYEKHTRAINLVGKVYETGAWIVQDEDEAKKWYRLAGKVDQLNNLNTGKTLSKAKPKSKGFFDFLKPSSPPPDNDDTSNMR